MADLPTQLNMKKIGYSLTALILATALFVILQNGKSRPKPVVVQPIEASKTLRSGAERDLAPDTVEPEPSMYSMDDGAPPIPEAWIQGARKATNSDISK